MTNVSKLKKPTEKRSRFGEPPKVVETKANLEKAPSGEKVPFQVRISAETRREFKAYAAERDLGNNELFEQVWRFYREHNA